MARIVADRGQQRVTSATGDLQFVYEYEMDCGCTVQVDARAFIDLQSSRGRGVGDALMRIAAEHNCDIVVHPGPPGRRRELAAQRAQEEAQYRYMGVPLRGDETWADPQRWQREILGAFRLDGPRRRRTPAEVERSIRASPPPQQDIAAIVRGAGARVEDEVKHTKHTKAVAPAQDERPDRFLLIEID